MDVFQPRRNDVYRPVFLAEDSESVMLSLEKQTRVKEILDVACSDSRFAQKAYDAIQFILIAEPTVPPQIESLSPNSAVLGSENFTLTVRGSGFSDGARIVWNGSYEPTTRVNDTELNTIVNMDTAEVAMDISVQVQNSDGVTSNTETFSLTSPVRQNDSSGRDSDNRYDGGAPQNRPSYKSDEARLKAEREEELRKKGMHKEALQREEHDSKSHGGSLTQSKETGTDKVESPSFGSVDPNRGNTEGKRDSMVESEKGQTKEDQTKSFNQTIEKVKEIQKQFNKPETPPEPMNKGVGNPASGSGEKK